MDAEICKNLYNFAIVPGPLRAEGDKPSPGRAPDSRDKGGHNTRNTMEIKIKAIHFDIADKLVAFTNKKIDKLTRRFEFITDVEVAYTLEKPEAALNKTAGVTLTAPGVNLFASKTADTFQQSLDTALQRLEKQLEKHKERK